MLPKELLSLITRYFSFSSLPTIRRVCKQYYEASKVKSAHNDSYDISIYYSGDQKEFLQEIIHHHTIQPYANNIGIYIEENDFTPLEACQAEIQLFCDQMKEALLANTEIKCSKISQLFDTMRLNGQIHWIASVSILNNLSKLDVDSRILLDSSVISTLCYCFKDQLVELCIINDSPQLFTNFNPKQLIAHLKQFSKLSKLYFPAEMFLQYPLIEELSAADSLLLSSLTDLTYDYILPVPTANLTDIQLHLGKFKQLQHVDLPPLPIDAVKELLCSLPALNYVAIKYEDPSTEKKFLSALSHLHHIQRFGSSASIDLEYLEAVAKLKSLSFLELYDIPLKYNMNNILADLPSLNSLQIYSTDELNFPPANNSFALQELCVKNTSFHDNSFDNLILSIQRTLTKLVLSRVNGSINLNALSQCCSLNYLSLTQIGSCSIEEKLLDFISNHYPAHCYHFSLCKMSVTDDVIKALLLSAKALSSLSLFQTGSTTKFQPTLSLQGLKALLHKPNLVDLALDLNRKEFPRDLFSQLQDYYESFVCRPVKLPGLHIKVW
jgi:hypothetical protein